MKDALVLLVATAAWALATPINTVVIERQADEIAASTGQMTALSWKGPTPGKSITQAGAGDGTLDQGPARTRLAWNGVSPGTPISQASSGDGNSGNSVESESTLGSTGSKFGELSSSFGDVGSRFEKTKRQWDEGYTPDPVPAPEAHDKSLGDFAFGESNAESNPSLRGANVPDPNSGTNYGDFWGKILITGADIFKSWKIGKRQGFGEGDGSSLVSGGSTSSFFGAGAGDGLEDWTPSTPSSSGVGSLFGGTAAESEGPLTESNPSLKGSPFRDPNSGVNSSQAAGSVFKTLGSVLGNLKFPDFGR